MNKLLNALKTECIDAGHSASSKDAVLSRIAELAAACPTLDNISQDHILQGMQERESLGSTGFGGGIAIPHCRLPDVKDFVVGLVSVPAGVAFDAMDEQPVRLFVFIVAPDNRSNDHIHLLSAISQALNIPGAVDEMLKCPTSESLRESFLRHVQDEATGDEEEDERSLFHIVIQNEDFFRDVLQVFGSMESSSAIVLDAESTSVYLQKLPLFSGFWTDSPRDFNRMIVAMVRRRLVNETIRRIERTTGPLKEARGVMVMVQDLFYAAGDLDL